VVAGDVRRGVTVLTAMTPVLTAVVGVAINLATDGKHSWWAWVLVGVVTAVSALMAVTLTRCQRLPERSSRGSAVDVRGGHGVQIGDHNTQANTFRSPHAP
jgi:hypothetical protein